MEETQAISGILTGNLGTCQRKGNTNLNPLQIPLTNDEFVRFFNLSLDLLCIAGFDGYFKYVNPAWRRCLGWTPDQLEAMSFLDLVHPDDVVATRKEMSNVSGGAEPIEFANRYRHQDGSYRWLRWRAQAEPERQRIYVIARDVSQEKRLEAEIIAIADEEKGRLGRELHDGLCQTLAGIAALSTTLCKSLRTCPESATAGEITNLLHGAINEARHLAHGYDLLNIELVGLEGALKKLAFNVEQLFRVSCTFKCDRPYQEFSNEIVRQLFRIAQEAVNNAVSHGRATSIEISLSDKSGVALLCVRDDGVGIQKVPGKPNDGIGMQTMAYRAKRLGASLEVRARDRGGTVVRCGFPLDDTFTN